MKEKNNNISYISHIRNIQRIKELEKEIRILNNDDDYLRLKNYNLIVYKIRLLKSYIGELIC